jgi:hypothetical protein
LLIGLLRVVLAVFVFVSEFVPACAVIAVFLNCAGLRGSGSLVGVQVVDSRVDALVVDVLPANVLPVNVLPVNAILLLC